MSTPAGFAQPSLNLIEKELSRWNDSNQKGIEAVVKKIKNLNSHEQSTKLFAQHQHKTSKLLKEIAHLESYQIPFGATDLEKTLEHIEALFVESILNQELNQKLKQTKN